MTTSSSGPWVRTLRSASPDLTSERPSRRLLAFPGEYQRRAITSASQRHGAPNRPFTNILATLPAGVGSSDGYWPLPNAPAMSAAFSCLSRAVRPRCASSDDLVTDPMAPLPHRQGVVYLAHRSVWTGPHGEPWSGYWERSDPPGVLGEGSWDSADAAVAWGRDRCDVVIVRLGTPPRLFSAGSRQPDGEELPAWPPADLDQFRS
jgi:hypothetical protein